MSFSLLPTMIVHSLTDISPEMLRQRGIKLLMLDFDNTIVPYTTDTPEPLMDQWLYDMKQSAQDEAIASARRSQVGTGDRSERIRTYNYPQGRVTDHRIGLTLYKIDSILNGDIDEIVDGLTTHYRAEALKAQENS